MRQVVLASLLTLLLVAPVQAENWPGWRGPRGDGTSTEQNIPTQWNAESGENVAWKVPIAGEGHSSPAIWENRVFLGTCLPESQQRVLLCLDAASGKTLWQKTVLKSKLETRHNLNSHASSTPATDGKHVYIAFLQIDGHTIPAPNVGRQRPVTPGEIVVACYDLQGNEQWQAKAGNFISAHGFCSNPVLFEDLVIINGDHDGDGYLAALEQKTGKVKWRVPRPNGIRSYVTPIIRESAGKTQMVMSGSQSVVSYDPRTGKTHWMLDGPTEQFVASMVYDGQRFFLTAGFPDHHIMALRADGSGKLTDKQIAWRTNRGAAYVTSPVVVGKYLLVVSDGGIASCFDAATGQRHWMERVAGKVSASPVTAGGLAYVIADDGTTTVLRPGTEFEKVAESKLGEPCSSSPAISGGRLFIRTHQHLFCIGKK